VGETITAEMPCVRGCTWPARIEGEEPTPRPAKHGLLCNSCYWRLWHALKEIPNLIANMRIKIDPVKATTYESFSPSKKPRPGSPAPLNIDPLDAADALIAKLAIWTGDLSERLKVRPPSIAIWMGAREVQGFRVVSVASAHDIATQLVHWFTIRLDDIAGMPSAAELHDDVTYGWKDSPGVYKLKGQYGIEPRPMRAQDRPECPVCGIRDIFVKWPDSLDPEIRVMCGRCKWVAEEELYPHYEAMFKSA
jgi:ribosomal protein S27AE